MSCACCGSCESEAFAISSGQSRTLLAQIVQCKRCGFLCADPRPTLAELEHLYSGYEIPAQWARGSGFFNSEIASLVASVTPAAGRILEVGCSYGKILYALQQKGFLVQGAKASSRACQYIRKEYGFPIYEGFIETYPDYSFR